MSIGSILVGIALVLVVAAYLARPFRTSRAGVDWDRAIEVWVAQARAGRAEGTEEAVNYCPKCGRRVGLGDHFCAGCGTPLQGDAE